METTVFKKAALKLKETTEIYPFLDRIQISYNTSMNFFTITTSYKSGENKCFFSIEEAEKRLDKLNILLRRFK